MSRTSTELVTITYPSAVTLTPSTQKETIHSTGRPLVEPEPVSRGVSDATEQTPPEASKKRTAAIITSVTCITGISCLLAGVVGIALPTIARDLQLTSNLLLWPASIYALTCGCTLLISGSIADVVGCRKMYLLGCILQSAFTLACGLSNTGMQLILFRALAGISISLCLPSAVSIVTNTFPPGKRRNIAFAAMGGGQPIGFSLGLTLGGLLTDTIGWRWSFYIAAILNTVIFVIALWGLPDWIDGDTPVTWLRLKTEVDWVGAILASTSLALLSYFFAVITEDTAYIKAPSSIALLVVAVALIPVFVLWVGRQERLNRPALIPNSLWQNKVFVCICINVFLVWGSFNAVENQLSFFFQYVQKISALKSSLLFLPAPFAGTLANVIVGLIVHRVRANHAIIVGTALACLSPLLMAFVNPTWSYWAGTFPAMLLNPVGADTLFTISNLLLTSCFPDKTQALAGGVFNTVAQIGKSVGLATAAVIASSTTLHSAHSDKESPEALLEGYRASWWYCFALCLTTVLVSLFGLRKIGRVGIKRE